MATYYKVELRLTECIERPADAHGFVRVDTETIACVEVKAGDASSVMEQVFPHVRALKDWHWEPIEERQDTVGDPS